MTSDEIIAIVKRMCLNNQLSASVLSQAQTDAINQLAHLLVAAAPEYFEKKVSLANGGAHVFSAPSDMLMLKQLWDYGGNVGTVSGAADNGAGLIRITHNIDIPTNPDDMVFPFVFPFEFSVGVESVVTIHDVAGCTEANGTWGATYVDTTHIDLYGSAFSEAYTSGGKIFIECEDTYKYPLERSPSKFETANDDTQFHYRGDKIIVNDPEFENDLIALYRYLPTTLLEIPSRIHFGIYAFAVLNLIDLRPRMVKVGDQLVESEQYATLKKNYDICQQLWKSASQMASSFRPVLSSNNISDRTDRKVKRWL